MKELLKSKLIQLHKDCFNDGNYADFFFAQRLPNGKSYVLEENGEPLSACYARFFTFSMDGKELTVPFLTGVATAPTHRYKGYATKVINLAVENLKNEGYPFLLLHPFNHEFYRKLGFETINYAKRYKPKDNPKNGVTFQSLSKVDLPVLKEIYDKEMSKSKCYLKRDEKEFELLIGYSLESDGFGYLIYEFSEPKGYVWYDDGACVEAVAEREELFDGLPYRDLPLLLKGDEIDYSMGAVLGLKSLLQSIPYCKEASGKIHFTFKGIKYELIVENGAFKALNEVDFESVVLDEKEMITICLGQGKRVVNNPFKDIIPYYDLFFYEIY